MSLLVETFSHKLFAPLLPPGAIQRDSILKRIFAEQTARVVLLQAPAGHGKTTLLQQAKAANENRGTLTGWLSLDEADNDLPRFVLHLQALLAAVVRSPRAEDSAAAQADGGKTERQRSPDWFISRLMQLGRPVCLFFDEFQTLSSKPVVGFFKELLDRIPDPVTIYIGSRSIPDIGLTRLMLNKQALVLRADDLCFSQPEVERFFAEETQGLKISKKELEAIYKQTEGWPAALQLLRLSLASPWVRKSLGDLRAYKPRELADYLADNVLSLQPAHIQEFLLRTSVLTRLTAPLCNAVTKRNDSQSILLLLEKSGLFLRSLDINSQWFKYHTLFSSFLAEQLRCFSEKSITELHQRAAKWYREQELYEEAMHHALAAGDHGFAADVLNMWASRLIADAFLTTVERWYDRLPLDEVEKRPELAIKIAWALTFLRRRQKLEPLLTMLERLPRSDDGRVPNADIVRSMAAILKDDIPGSFEIIRRVEVRGREVDGFRAFELGAAANLHGYLALTADDFESAHEYFALARAYSDRASAPFSWAYAVGTAGVNLIIQGMLGEAVEHFRLGHSDPRIFLSESSASASLVSCYVQALYEANDLETAESQFNQFHDVIANTALLDYTAVSYITMARIHDAKGRPAKALEILDEAENIGHTSFWPRLLRIISWERVRRSLMRGELDRAQVTASRIPKEKPKLPAGWVPFSEDTEGDAIGEIRLALHKGDADSALKLIAPELAAAQQRGRVRRRIKLHVLDALALKKKGAEAFARKSLRKALQLAAPGKFVRIFLDEGEAIVQLLHAEHEDSMAGGDTEAVPRELVVQLLNASGADPSKSQTQLEPAFQPLEPLTYRERKILTLLASGESNKEIAGKVFLSENTVKFHLKNIYSKLAVTSRVQAVNAARQMGLIKASAPTRK